MITWFIGAIMSLINKKAKRENIERKALCERVYCNSRGIKFFIWYNF